MRSHANGRAQAGTQQDAVRVPPGLQGHPNDTLAPGQFTDDTQTMMLVAMLLADGKYTDERYGIALRELYSREALRFPDGSVSAACDHMVREKGHSCGIRSTTAGCLPPALPFALAYPDLREATERAVRACSVTHTHPVPCGGLYLHHPPVPCDPREPGPGQQRSRAGKKRGRGAGKQDPQCFGARRSRDRDRHRSSQDRERCLALPHSPDSILPDPALPGPGRSPDRLLHMWEEIPIQLGFCAGRTWGKPGERRDPGRSPGRTRRPCSGSNFWRKGSLISTPGNSNADFFGGARWMPHKKTGFCSLFTKNRGISPSSPQKVKFS